MMTTPTVERAVANFLERVERNAEATESLTTPPVKRAAPGTPH